MHLQLKKLINQVVNELASLGLRPSLLQQLLEQRENGEKLDLDGLVIPGLRASDAELVPEVTYELLPGANSAEPQLRLRLRKRTNGSNGSSQVDLTQTKLRSLQDHTGESDDGSVADLHSSILSPKCVVFAFSSAITPSQGCLSVSLLEKSLQTVLRNWSFLYFPIPRFSTYSQRLYGPCRPIWRTYTLISSTRSNPCQRRSL